MISDTQRKARPLSTGPPEPRGLVAARGGRGRLPHGAGLGGRAECHLLGLGGTLGSEGKVWGG